MTIRKQISREKRNAPRRRRFHYITECIPLYERPCGCPNSNYLPNGCISYQHSSLVSTPDDLMECRQCGAVWAQRTLEFDFWKEADAAAARQEAVELLRREDQLTGLLSPEGKFFPCWYAEHRLTFDTHPDINRLGKETWDQAGFLHVSDGWWMDLAYLKREPSQAQLDFIFDWVQKNPDHRAIPKWVSAIMLKRAA
jgi:hypothetical protein